MTGTRQVHDFVPVPATEPAYIGERLEDKTVAGQKVKMICVVEFCVLAFVFAFVI